MIEIRPVTTIEESRLIEGITRAAWGGGTEIAIPDHLILTMAKEAGGVVLLAWDRNKPIGYCLGFLAFTEPERRLKHCSHVAGVIPGYQGRRVGEMIKWAQRDAVLETAVDHITWTYDPLETRNGRLNIHKLGAICNTYKRNVYGELRDALNWGVPTDRFRVDWWLTSPRVEAHKAGSQAYKSFDEWLAAGVKVVNMPTARPRVQQFPVDIVGTVDNIWYVGSINTAAFEQKHLLVAVPKDFQSIKKADVGLGLAWRMHTREIFERAFAAGFVTTDLLVEEQLCYYLLERQIKSGGS